MRVAAPMSALLGTTKPNKSHTAVAHHRTRYVMPGPTALPAPSLQIDACRIAEHVSVQQTLRGDPTASPCGRRLGIEADTLRLYVRQTKKARRRDGDRACVYGEDFEERRCAGKVKLVRDSVIMGNKLLRSSRKSAKKFETPVASSITTYVGISRSPQAKREMEKARQEKQGRECACSVL